jgi:uncharacterized protein (DUF362 family)
MMKTRRVILRRCDSYDVAAIERIVEQAIDDLGERPHGKILVKPNVVCSTPVVRSAHTHTAVVEAAVNVPRRRAAGSEIGIGESGGMAIPTRLFFYHAGYSAMAKRLGVPLRDFNEERVQA